MTELTAMEIADKFDELASIMRAHNVPTLPKLHEYGKKATDMLRQQYAELGRLAMKNAAYASLTKAQDAELSLHRDRAAAYRAAVKNIDSEREANAILTAERDAAIAAAVAAEREVSEMSEQALKPCPFCGSATAPTLIMRSVSHHVECARPAAGGCAARGPYKSVTQDAIAAWNKRADQAEELAALRSFALAVMDFWPDGWGIDGDDLKDIATEHGMLVPEIRNSPCADGCWCAEHVLPKEWTDGVVCYRQTSLLTGVKK